MASQLVLGPIEKRIASEFLRIELDKLEEDWVKEIIDNEFMQCENLPLQYEEVLDDCRIVVRLNAAQKHCLSWIETNQKISGETTSFPADGEPSTTSGNETLEKSAIPESVQQSSSNGGHFWGYLLSEEKIKLKNLLALIGFLINKGTLLICEPADREKCFAAANLYLTLISIPGSMGFHVFLQMLYLKALSLLQLYVQASKYRKCDPPSSKKGQKQSVPEEDDDEEGAHCISEAEIAAIDNYIVKYLDTLALVSQHLSFKRYPNVLKDTIESMLPLISLGKGQISLKALEVIQQFCNPLHGDAIQTVHYVFAHLLPYLALDRSEKDLNTREVLALRDISFNLVRNFVQKFGEPIFPILKGLIQHLCLDVVDRAEFRTRTAQTAMDLLNLVPEERQKDMVHWFLLLAHREQAYLRLFGTELMTLLLQQERVDPLVLAVLCSHCSDPSATVRAKALSILCDCIESRNASLMEIFDNIFSGQQRPRRIDNEVDILELLLDTNGVQDALSLLPQASAILKLLEERAIDEKVYVRKNALHLLLTIMRRPNGNRFLTKELLQLLGKSCRDVALLVRRHMAQMLTELVLQYAEHAGVRRMWVQSVLPLVLDSETRVQEKALECLEQLVLTALNSSDPQNKTLGWSVLEIITDQGFSTYLSKAVELWARQKLIQPQLLRTLQENIEEYSNAAWTFMAIIARHVTIDYNVRKFVLEYLQQHIGSTRSCNVYSMQQVLKILAATLPNMKEDQQQTIRSVLSRPIANYQLPTDVISCACDLVVYCIQQQYSDEDAARKEAAHWAEDILQSCGEYLGIHLRKQECVSFEEEEQLARRIFTLGCAALHTPWSVNKRHFLMLQHAAFQPESGVDAPILSSQAQSQPTRKLPPRLQAAAIISLGKLSVQNEEMAKQLIPGLGKLLETTPHEAVRNNIVCILCDWVVRYGTAVDPVMSQVTACLRDPSPLVRKQTLVLLIHLLQEDYLKIRGTFFFRILQLACDDDESLRDLALFYVTQRLLHRQPTIIQQHFIECIFHFNEYIGHPTFNKYVLTDRERHLFSVAGPAQAKKRMDIYVFMLQNMDDETRFQLTFRLSRDVLLGVVEGTMPLKNPCTETVLKEALAILASDDIKLASLTTSTDEDPVEKEDVAQAIVQSTKKAIIAQVVKRNVVENIVPIVVQLKRKLASLKSPLMGDLMSFLRELMKDYKDEITEVLDADKQLMAEIAFDLNRFEQQQKQEAAAAKEKARMSLAPVTQTPGHQNPTSRSGFAPPDEQTEEEDLIPERTKSTEQPPDQPKGNENENGEEEPEEEEQMEVDSADTAQPNEPAAPHDGEPPVVPSVQEPPVQEPPSTPEPVEQRKKRTTRSKGDNQCLKPPKDKVKARLLQPRTMSTPIRDNTVTDVTFRIDSEADLSAIPFPDGRPKKRGRVLK